jgi:hypothetical protein
MAFCPRPAQATAALLRKEGIHNFELHNGQTVTGFSFNTWKGFKHTLERMAEASETIGSLLITPELVTIGNQPIEMVVPSRPVIKKRIKKVMELSTAFPESTIVLGTPTFRPSHKPRNSLVYIKDGQEIGRTYKLPGGSSVEPQVFEQAKTFSDSCALPNHPSILPMLSSDLFLHTWTDNLLGYMFSGDKAHDGKKQPSPFTDVVDTLVVSAGWNVPVVNHEWVRNDDYHIKQLDFFAQKLFVERPQLQDIVVVDRLPHPVAPGVGQQEPINAHYQRIV